MFHYKPTDEELTSTFGEEHRSQPTDQFFGRSSEERYSVDQSKVYREIRKKKRLLVLLAEKEKDRRFFVFRLRKSEMGFFVLRNREIEEPLPPSSKKSPPSPRLSSDLRPIIRAENRR